ncbi:CMP-sialic acid transporter 4-like [Tropilaelaps mercedesae]|uniref:CMP-sialic acid transporter 4-like n=1 Tax=Tropilaelaps mercedesae TaxID=418985 RepID=A0A1V9XCB9_9ACAR|nr:CMP-sialic acid transporter 4-like [Tropilaelaps mercedesae]
MSRTPTPVDSPLFRCPPASASPQLVGAVLTVVIMSGAIFAVFSSAQLDRSQLFVLQSAQLTRLMGEDDDRSATRRCPPQAVLPTSPELSTFSAQTHTGKRQADRQALRRSQLEGRLSICTGSVVAGGEQGEKSGEVKERDAINTGTTSTRVVSTARLNESIVYAQAYTERLAPPTNCSKGSSERLTMFSTTAPAVTHAMVVDDLSTDRSTQVPVPIKISRSTEEDEAFTQPSKSSVPVVNVCCRKNSMPLQDIELACSVTSDSIAGKTALSREVVLTSIPSLVLCFAMACIDAVKLVVSFAMKDSNNDRYPLDSCMVVLLIELIKAIVALGLHIGRGGGNPLTKFDVRTIVPCVIYAITNNIFFIALLFVSPPVWMILIQMRLIFLLFIYRVMFKHTIVAAQWVGAVFLVVSVALMQVDHVHDFMNAVGPALILATISSLLSALAGVYIELILKTEGDSELWRRQFHLYSGSALVSIIPFLVSKYHFGRLTFDLVGDSALLNLFICASIVLSAAFGIATSLVIKKLDNIIRLQLGALVYIFTALLNKVVFPDKFDLSGWYALSVLLVLYSMYIMERKSFR